jgi:hypothetical protein
MINQSSLIQSAAGTLALALLLGCTSSLRPVEPNTRLGQRPAKETVLALNAPCTTQSGRVPMGRPDGERGHTLPAGKYVPTFEDQRGVYFQSPAGIAVTEPLPVGTRSRPGGIYLPNDGEPVASEYLGDGDRVTERSRLPEHCDYSLEKRDNPSVSE